MRDPLSAMTERFNWPLRAFARRYFRHFRLPDADLERLHGLEAAGSIVYVMRYASRLDYFLFNFLFRREGLRLSQYANGIRFFYYRRFFDALRCWFRGGDRSPEAVRARVSGIVGEGQSLFLFLRTARLRDRLRSRREEVERGQRRLDLMAEVLRAAETAEHEVHVVPIALFWRKGPLPTRRFVNLPYSSVSRPSDLAKISSFLIAYRDLAIKLGDAISIRDFRAGLGATSTRTAVRSLRRRTMQFFAAEERVVEGPRLRPVHRVQRIVLRDPGVRQAISERMESQGGSLASNRNEAEKIVREIAANLNPSLMAFANTLTGWIFRRLFASIDATGLERVAQYAREHPVILVPSHRSYFDFLILSWLFYRNYLVPPHVAARENMAFGPFGFLFRRLGAFFLRKDFGDDLYKAVFRAYLAHLVREGYTQEFFIEGGRSRTGKSLAPRLGILSWILEAFVDAGRRDMFFVPIGISYERLVEESSMIEELEGGEKSEESVTGLVRARRFLRNRFGSAHVRFGEPISVADFLARRGGAFRAAGTEEARRSAIEELGNEIVERINWSMVATGTAVAASALLGGSPRGLFRTELVVRMREIADLLRLQDVPMTSSLAAIETEFKESIDFLVRADLVKVEEDPRGEIVYFEEGKRRALDVYRNVIAHFLATPSFAARRILSGVSRAELRDDLQFWLEFFYSELFAPTGMVMALHVDAFLDYFERIGALEVVDERLYPTEKGRPYFRFLAEQTRSLIESYHVSLQAVSMAEDGTSENDLEKTAELGFQRAALLGEVQRREAWTSVGFRNALELLVRREVLVRTSGDKPKERLYARGPRFEDLPGLLERLAASLGAL